MGFFCVFFPFRFAQKRGRILFNFQAHSAHVDEHSDHSDAEHSEPSTEHATHASEEHSTEHSTEHSEEHSTDWASVQATWLMVTMQVAGQSFFVPNLCENFPGDGALRKPPNVSAWCTQTKIRGWAP